MFLLWKRLPENRCWNCSKAINIEDFYFANYKI